MNAVYIEDYNLATSALSGDENAWNEIISVNQKKIYAICFRILKRADLAEDLCQDVFLQLFRKLGKFKGESKLSTWIFRIATNQCLMFLRRSKQFPECQPIDGYEPPETLAPTIVKLPDYADVEQQIMIEMALKTLPAKQKTTLLLHDYLGFEHLEVAQILGSSEGTSKSQLFKAREKVKKSIRRKTYPKAVSSFV